MYIDVLVGIIALTSFYKGYTKGLVGAILSLVAVLVGSILSLKLAHTLAAYLQAQNIINNKFILPLSFILIFVATIYIFKLIIKAIEGALKIALLGWVNKLVGGTVYALMGLFIVSALFWLASFVKLITPNAINESKTYVWVQPLAPKGINLLSHVTPYCSNLVSQVSTYLSNFK